MGESTVIIAFDQHAASVTAAVLLPGHPEPAVQPLASDLLAIRRFVTKVSDHAPVRCCYEAGPCGFELQRYLQHHGIPCEVIAPSLVPRTVGDRIKTDRRDARRLAILYRVGALTPVHVPTEEEEAARDLLRCREDIRADLLRARHRLSTFLLRHGRPFTVTRAWTRKYDTWLRGQLWPLTALAHTYTAYVRTVDEAVTRLHLH